MKLDTVCISLVRFCVCEMKKDVSTEELKELDVFLKDATPCVGTAYSTFADAHRCGMPFS